MEQHASPSDTNYHGPLDIPLLTLQALLCRLFSRSIITSWSH
ncbi:hypothetical protein DICA3_B06678 [Diutina catenulata]